MTTFDHLKLTRRNAREVERFRRFVCGAPRGKLTHLGVMHEADGSCCRKEPWPRTIETLVRLVNALGERGQYE